MIQITRQCAILFILSLFFFLCENGFAQSDSKAVAIANEVIEANGGKDNWNNTHIIKWKFFGNRLWYWDKWTGDVRCEVAKDDTRIVMNIHSKKGEVFAHGRKQTDADSLNKFLKRGYEMWINDSYWLVMPFKLLDPGTQVKYLGEKKNAKGETCDVLELTFKNVGVTPDNKYWIYVDPSSRLVVQWDYYSNFNDETPRMSTPWEDYKEYGNIMLSGGRGKGTLTDIEVFEKLPKKIFKSTKPIE